MALFSVMGLRMRIRGWICLVEGVGELLLGAKVLEMFLGFSCLDAEKRGGLAELCMGICYLPYTAWTNACSGTGRYSTARSPEVSVRKHISAC